MKLSVIIPTKERKQIFASTLSAALHATRHIDAEIIIINDSDNDLMPTPGATNVRVLKNPKRGVAAARNFGFKNSSGELLLFLDNDIVISKESVDCTLQFHRDNPHACLNPNWEYSPDTLAKMSSVILARFLTNFGMISFKGWYNDPSWKDNQLFSSRSIASFHLSISRYDFFESGGYNEEFPFAGFEDYDFPLRLKRRGIKFFIDSRITVYHNEVDRLELDNWLASQENRACSRRRAVALGYRELALEYHFLKRLMLEAVIRHESHIKSVLTRMPNSSVADRLSFKMLSILQASRIYKGYTLE